MKRRKEIIALLFCLLVSSAYAQTQQSSARHEFSIGKCVDYGIKNNVKNFFFKKKAQCNIKKSPII